MSKDIRSFFTVFPKKTSDSKQSKPLHKPKIPIIVSDDEDVISDSPKKPLTGLLSKTKRKKQIISSDSEDEGETSKKISKSPKKKPKVFEEKPKLKPVSIDDVFNKTVRQSKVEVQKPEPSKNDIKEHPKKKQQRKNTELGIHEDKAFEQTLIELDEDSDDTILLENMDILDKTIEEAMLADINEKPEEKSTHKLNSNENDSKRDENPKKDKHELQSDKQERTNKKSNEAKDTPKKFDKRQRKHSESESTPSKRQKLEHTDSGIDPDQEKWERKRQSAALYQQYLHRGGPKHHGKKMYPKGKPDCLNNLTFLRTGVLDSLESEEFDGLVKDHGGRVVHAVSKKVNYVVVGDAPGPAKLEKARRYNIPEISEDQFLDLILTKSGMKAKYAVKVDSEDFGLGTSECGSPIKLETCDKDSVVEEIQSNKFNLGPSKREKGEEEKSKQKQLKEERRQDIGKNHESKKVKGDNKTDSKTLIRLEKEEKNESKIIKETKKHKDRDVTDQTQKDVADLKKNKVEHVGPKEEKKGSISKDIHKDKTTKTNEKVEEKIQTDNSVSSEKTDSESTEYMSWTEKYKPSNLKAVIGQQEANSNMNKLKKWLENWYKNQEPERRKKLPRPTLYNQFGGEWFKAALLSGPPGVGKTTTATLVAKELGFDIVEFNASDTRSKKLLHEEISQMMQMKTVAGFVSGENNINKKRVLLMDEVDGMAGNEDRGGIAELISFIKTASFPIICMCNNRDHQKMRTLVNYCFGLRFGKPNMQQIRGAMLSICFKEKLNIKPDALGQLIIGTGCDIRQTLNHLALWSAADKNLSAETVQKESKNSQKDLVFGPWEVIKKVFNSSENADMNLGDKSRLFFYDYSLGPLFVQENYLSVKPNCSCPKNQEEKETLIRACLTADSLSIGDMIESKIRSTNNWSLLESQAFYCTVLPSHYMSGTIGRVNFPTWFGKNSQRNKSLRMIGELYSHARTSISGDKFSMRLDYAQPLRDLLVTPLKENGSDGIRNTLDVMKSYTLLRDDLTNICELLTCFDKPNVFNSIDWKVKSALTRLYNKEMVLTFAPPVASKKKKGTNTGAEDLMDEEEEELSDQEEKEDNIDEDALIKIKNKDSGKAGTSKSSESKNSGKGKTSKTSESKTSKGKRKK